MQDREEKNNPHSQDSQKQMDRNEDAVCLEGRVRAKREVLSSGVYFAANNNISKIKQKEEAQSKSENDGYHPGILVSVLKKKERSCFWKSFC